MSDFHNTIIDMIKVYLDDYEDDIFELYHTYDKSGERDISWEIKDMICESCNNDNLEENYPDFDTSTMTADTVLEIQNHLVDEYGYECLGEGLFNKDHLVVWYMLSEDVLNEITGNYDIIKIQRLWRGYDCRWKNPFLLIKS